MRWHNKVTVKHLLTEKEDIESVRNSMKAIADILLQETCFSGFKMTLKKFHEIPDSDGIITPVDYANKLLDKMYNYADENSIWIN